MNNSTVYQMTIERGVERGGGEKTWGEGICYRTYP